MAVSYKKLWKLLIDRDMKKKDLCEAAGISHASVAKLGKNENVTTDVLVKICTALKCDISDIMEIIEIERKRRDGTSFKERKTDTGKAYYEMGRWEDPDVRGYHA